MRKIYLAGSCSAEMRTSMVRIARHLRDNAAENFEVYCPFELKIPNAWDMSQEDWAREVFYADKKAIDECDIFVMVSPGRNSTAGTNWEQGYAYAQLKTVVVAQYGEENTSLMTYWGCDSFRNYTNIDELIRGILFQVKTTPHDKCTTILT